MHHFSRRGFVRLCSALFTLLIGSLRSAFGQSSGVTTLPRQCRGSGRVAPLKKQLEAGLKARRPVEFKFISDVVKLVEERKLPLQMVMETFHYARRKRPYPFQYFQRALALRAARIGVKIKPV